MDCIVVDDDDILRLDLENKISQVPFLNLIGMYSSAREAIKLMKSQKIDLIFLDVMMPEINGLELLSALASDKPQIILMSSNKKFALDAFDFDVTDFLVKPIFSDRFFRAVAKAKKIHEAKIETSLDEENCVFVKVNKRLVKIDIRDILFIEAMADYMTINTANTRYTIHSTMKEMEDSLPAKYFFRIHNSYIIRLDKISEIEDGFVTVGKKLIRVSRSKIDGLMQKLKFLK